MNKHVRPILFSFIEGWIVGYIIFTPLALIQYFYNFNIYFLYYFIFATFGFFFAIYTRYFYLTNWEELYYNSIFRLFDYVKYSGIHTFEEWDKLEEEGKEKRPIRYFITNLRQKISCKIKNNWYYLKCRVWYRYNVLTVKSLPPTWVDRDLFMLHANFEILEDFVEKEDYDKVMSTEEELRKIYKQEHSDTTYEKYVDNIVKDYQKLKELYLWWQKRKNGEVDCIHAEDYDKQDIEDNKMLHRLINLRMYLWT